MARPQRARPGRRAGELDAIVTTAAGCGTTLKAYGRLLAGEPEAARRRRKARDILEFLGEVGLPPVVTPAARIAVAYHAPCSLQHGQKVRPGPRRLLAEAGFEVAPDRRRATSAAARPASTTSCSRSWPAACATARPPTSRAPAQPWWRPATSAAWPRSRRRGARPWCTRWSCWTGRPAARSLRRSAAEDFRARNRSGIVAEKFTLSR